MHVPKRHLLLVLAGAALVAWLGWRLASRGGPGADVDAPVSRTLDASPARGPTLAGHGPGDARAPLAGEGGASRAGDGDGLARDPGQDAGPPAILAKAQQRLRLDLRAEGGDRAGMPSPDWPDLDGTLSVLGRRESGPRRTRSPADDATGPILWFDLTEIVDDPVADVVHVAIDLEGWVAAPVVVELGKLPHETDASGRITWTATALLTPAVRVRGRVVAPDGSPAGGATVEVYAVTGSTIDPHVRQTQQADSAGQFALGLPDQAEVLLIAHQPAFAPASSRVRVRRGDASAEELVLDLPAGFSITGRVRVSGVRIEKENEWTVQFDTELERTFGRGESGWGMDPHGRVHRGWGVVAVGDDGTFEVAGLGALPYQVVALGDQATPCIDAALSLKAAPTVTPPSDVVISMEPAWLVCTVEGLPEDGDAFLIIESAQTGWATEIDGDSTLRVGVQPGLAYTLQLYAGPQLNARRELTSPAAGEVLSTTLALRPPSGRATLTVHFVGETPGATGIALEAIRATSDESVESVYQVVTPDEQGRATLKMPPGRYKLSCQPGQSVWGQRPVPALRVEKEVELRAEGSTVEVPVRVGGLILVEARAANGEGLPARLTTRAVGGTPRSVKWVCPSHDRWESQFDSTQLASEGIGLTRGGIPPGLYDLTATLDGFAPVTTRVAVKPGQTARVSLTLHRQR